MVRLLLPLCNDGTGVHRERHQHVVSPVRGGTSDDPPKTTTKRLLRDISGETPCSKRKESIVQVSFVSVITVTE